MKNFIFLIVVVAAGLFFVFNNPETSRWLNTRLPQTPKEAVPRKPLAKAAATSSPQSTKADDSGRFVGKGPRFWFGGRITQHVAGGVLVHCDEYLTPLPAGYDFSAINGDFFLVGHPTAAAKPDDAELTFEAQHAGMYSYNTVSGANRTVIALVYVPPERVPAATPKPGDWMFKKKGRGALDQPPR